MTTRCKHFDVIYQNNKLVDTCASGNYEEKWITEYCIVMDLINALPGNSSINTVRHTTLDEAVFSMSPAPRPVLLTDQ
jgi:hypothetical protein